MESRLHVDKLEKEATMTAPDTKPDKKVKTSIYLPYSLLKAIRQIALDRDRKDNAVFLALIEKGLSAFDVTIQGDYVRLDHLSVPPSSTTPSEVPEWLTGVLSTLEEITSAIERLDAKVDAVKVAAQADRATVQAAGILPMHPPG